MNYRSKMTIMTSIPCPICNGESEIIADLPARVIRDKLLEFLSRGPPPQNRIEDYKLRSCTRCDLKFFEPMSAGDEDFYDWVTSIETYYPKKRWEWGVCLELLASDKEQAPGVLVDVGCGSGAFLSEVAATTRWRAIGLDFCQESIDACRRQGLEAFCGKVEDGLAFAKDGVDAFTLWHVVEHVENPLSLLNAIKLKLRPGGRIFFSVPLSPMSSEVSRLDPLNLAPHHLTRWSISALSNLAETLQLPTVIIVPRASNFIVRSMRSLALHAFPPFFQATRAWKATKLLKYVFQHPFNAVKDLILQFRRPTLEGRTLPDLVLVCMSAQAAGIAVASTDHKTSVEFRFLD